MIGQTNAQSVDITRSTDPHTLFLMTDSVRDRSMYNWGLETFGSLSVNDSHSYAKRDGRNSIFFDGSSGIRLSNPNFISSSTNWTLEVWIQTGGDRNSAIFWTPINDSTPYGLLWGYYQSAMRIYLANSTSSWNYINGQNCNTENVHWVWRHQCLVRNGSTISAYINGTLVGSWTVTGDYTFTGYPWIGKYDNSANQYILAHIQDFRISDVARYTGNFTPPQRLL